MVKDILLGFDVGGTKIEAALLRMTDKSSPSSLPLHWKDSGGVWKRREGEVLARERVSTEREKGYEAILQKIGRLGEELLEKEAVGRESLLGVGLGLPGTIHPQTHQMLNGNTQALIGPDLLSDLLRVLGNDLRVRIDNDANCFALSEAMCGAGLDHAQMMGASFTEATSLGIILGTGCGGGAVLRGEVLRGRNGGASEFGHMTLVSDGHPCYCGRRGCAEQYLSGTGFEASYRQRQGAQDKMDSSAKDIFARVDQGDPIALAVFKDYQEKLAHFLGNLVCAYDPEFIVLGGGMSAQPRIYQDLEQMVLARTFLPLNDIPIYPAKLGDSSGVIGAALLPLIQP